MGNIFNMDGINLENMIGDIKSGLG